LPFGSLTKNRRMSPTNMLSSHSAKADLVQNSIHGFAVSRKTNRRQVERKSDKLSVFYGHRRFLQGRISAVFKARLLPYFTNFSPINAMFLKWKSSKSKKVKKQVEYTQQNFFTFSPFHFSTFNYLRLPISCRLPQKY
jgi:hypothetical protein